MMSPLIGGLQKTTNYKVVLPFYIYAALGFLAGTILLLCHTETVGAHYFNPQALAITHTMALAWGTMIIFGASHQLLPVLVEGELDSDRLAYLTFIFTAIGTPLLIYGFYMFDMGLPLQIGAILINIRAITTNTRDSLTKSFPGWEIILHLVFEPAWNFNMISPEGREFLGR